MSDSKVDVKTEALQELAGSLGKFSSSVTATLNEANRVLSESLDRMRTICEQIREKWEEARQKRQEAEEEWNIAENEHSACLASQEQDEDGNWHPSCHAESIRATAARIKFQLAQKEENEKRQIYENATQIMRRAKESIDEYKYGSGAVLEQIAGDYSQAAISEIGNRLEQLGEILDSNLSLGINYPIEKPRSLYNPRHSATPTSAEKPSVVYCPKCNRPIRQCNCGRNKGF